MLKNWVSEAAADAKTVNICSFPPGRSLFSNFPEKKLSSRTDRNFLGEQNVIKSKFSQEH